MSEARPIGVESCPVSPPRRQISIRGAMLGVLIAALYLAEESRLVLVVLAYILLPIVFGLMTFTKTGTSMACRFPWSCWLVEISTAFTLMGWFAILAIMPALTSEPAPGLLRYIAGTPLMLPVGLFGLVLWRLLTLPRTERTPS